MRFTRMALPTAAILVLASACGSPADQVSTAGEPSSAVVQGATEEPSQTAEETDESTAEEAAETTEEESATAELSVGDYGFTQFAGSEWSDPGVTYAVVFTNSGSAIATSAQYQIAFEDADGTILSSESGYLTAVLPETSVAAAGYLYDVEGVEKMTVQLLPGSDEALEEESANFEVEKVSTKADEYGGLTTTAVVKSPFTKDLENLEAVAVYRDASGAVLGGDFTYLNFVPAGGSAALEISGMSWEGDVPAETEVYIALSSLSLME